MLSVICLRLIQVMKSDCIEEQAKEKPSLNQVEDVRFKRIKRYVNRGVAKRGVKYTQKYGEMNIAIKCLYNPLCTAVFDGLLYFYPRVFTEKMKNAVTGVNCMSNALVTCASVNSNYFELTVYIRQGFIPPPKKNIFPNSSK